MTTEIKLTKAQRQAEDLKTFSALLQENGFDVIVSAKHSFQWLFFHKDGKIGTVNADYFGGYNFGTVHKPCRECGTGFGTERETDLTVENAKGALLHAPSWASRSDVAAIRKYKSIEDFINSTHNKWAEYYVISKEQLHNLQSI